MGKYAATRAVQRDHKSGSSSSLESVGDYLFDVPEDEFQYEVQSFLSGADPTGIYSGYLTARDNSAYMRDYLHNTGLDWSDIKYPSRTVGWGSSGNVGRSAVNFVSRSIHRLYR